MPTTASDKPAVLIAYPFLDEFLRDRQRFPGLYRNWVLDSGAFSAFNSGVTIDRDEFTDRAAQLLATDTTLLEVFALDVIGDWRASLRNAERMNEHGVPAIPTFHADEPLDYLKGIARDYPKIALGGVALRTPHKKLAWAEQCFAHVWPCKVHGFAFAGKNATMRLPFHSVDASNWKVGPMQWGRFLQLNPNKSFFGLSSHSTNKGIRNTATTIQGIRGEVEEHLRLERIVRGRWRKEMAALGDTEAPTIRLAGDLKTLARAYGYDTKGAAS